MMLTVLVSLAAMVVMFAQSVPIEHSANDEFDGEPIVIELPGRVCANM